MRAHKFQKLILLMLSLYCGQTFALPLLSCCDFMSQMPENEMAEHHDHSTMAKMAEAPDELKIISENHESACISHCEYCAASSIVLINTINLNQPAFTKHDSSYLFLLHSTPSNSPFRPPISS